MGTVVIGWDIYHPITTLYIKRACMYQSMRLKIVNDRRCVAQTAGLWLLVVSVIADIPCSATSLTVTTCHCHLSYLNQAGFCWMGW